MSRPLPSTWLLLRSAVSGHRPSALSAYRLLAGCMLVLLLKPLEVVNSVALFLDRFLYPSFPSTVITQPLFIVGPPRSGTTLLHRLIALDDQQFTTMSLWELVFAPAICQKQFWIGVWGVDRYFGGMGAKLLNAVEWWVAKCTHQIHPTSLSLPEEDYLLLASRRHCFLWVLAFPTCDAVWSLGTFDEHFSRAQRDSVLAEYRELVQRHLYFRGSTKTYLSKNPSFTGWTRALAERFPDARFLAIWRTPEQALPSQLSSVRSALSWFGYDVADPGIVSRFLQLFRSYYQRVLYEFPRESQSKFRVIAYPTMKESPTSVVMTTLSSLGYRAGASFQEKLIRAAELSRRHQSQHRYSLEEFGIAHRELYETFGDVFTNDCGAHQGKPPLLNQEGSDGCDSSRVANSTST